MQGAAFIDLGMVVCNNKQREQIAEARTIAHMRGKACRDEKAQEEERRNFFYSPQALYDESLFPLDTLIPGAKDTIALLDSNALRVIFISSVPEYLRKARIEQLEKAGLLYVYSKYGPATGYTPLHELMLKVEPFKFTKLDEVIANLLQPVSVFLSLADVVL